MKIDPKAGDLIFMRPYSTAVFYDKFGSRDVKFKFKDTIICIKAFDTNDRTITFYSHTYGIIKLFAITVDYYFNLC